MLGGRRPLGAFAAAPADAALITFTNRAAFEAAVGTFTVTNLNAEATGTFTSRDLGPFTASETSPDLLIGIAGGGPNLFTSAQNVTSPDGTNHLFFEASFTTSPLTLTFDTPISAFGFDFRTTDSTQDGLDLVVQGMLFNVSLSAPSSGFFGVIDTTGTVHDGRVTRRPGWAGSMKGWASTMSLLTVRPSPRPGSLGLLAVGAATAWRYLGPRGRKQPA